MAMQSIEHVLSNIDDTINYFHPFSMLAPTTTPATDTYTFSQALQEPDAPDFLHAAQAEIAAHETNGHWLKVPCSTLPASHNPIPAVWAMKRKICPDGTLIKHKACLCTGGHCQVFELNYWDTYSPVVQWMTVCLLLVIFVLENSPTQQVDLYLPFLKLHLMLKSTCFSLKALMLMAVILFFFSKRISMVSNKPA